MSERRTYAAIAPPAQLTSGSNPTRPPFGAGRFQAFSLSGPRPGIPSATTTTAGTGGATQPAVSHGFGFSLKQPTAQIRKRVHLGDDDDDYFDNDDDNVGSSKPHLTDDEESTDLQQEPDSSKPEEDKAEADDEDEEDPLDAFMKDIEQDVKKTAAVQQSTGSVESAEVTTSASTSAKPTPKDLKGVRSDIDQEDIEESYYKYVEENPNAAKASGDGEEDDQIEYDQDGNPIDRKKYIDPLSAIDHSAIKYEPFDKDFYDEHPDISQLSRDEVDALRKTLEIKVSGAGPIPRPVCSFGHLSKTLDEPLMDLIRKCEFTQPTSIQAQAIPIALSGRDMIGVAVTGSGKTAAYLWPMLVHIMAQRELRPGEGPIGIILVPTRELAIQVYGEVKKFGTKAYGLRAVCAYGGGSRWEQSQDLAAGAEIVVATPGRIIDHIKSKATILERVTFLVLDEADRMFDMGFEPQVRSICDHVRLDRQCLMFSATFKKRIERLARDSLTDPIKVVHGKGASSGNPNLGEANEDVTQLVHVFSDAADKWLWLTKRLVEFQSSGSVLIFVTRKANADELATNLKQEGVSLELMHGDMDQGERNRVMQAFKKKAVPVLVATDVAARGLDVPHIRTVVNYDVARDIETHTHRVGRTGRAGEKGFAYTLVTPKDKEFAGHLVRNLETANQHVPDKLLDLAMESAWFQKARFKNGGKKGARGGRKMGGLGLGYQERLAIEAGPKEGAKPSYNAAPPPSTYNTNTSTQQKPFSSTSRFSAMGTNNRPAFGSISSSSGSGGGGSSGLSAMRAQMAAKFKSQFCSSSSDSFSGSNQPAQPQPQAPAQDLYGGIPERSTTPTSSSQPDGTRKRSRWDT